MTFVGKILVVLQVVLSICFMAFAGAVLSAQQNWKNELAKVRVDYDTLRDAMDDKEALLAQAVQDHNAEVARLTQVANTEIAKVRGLENDLDAANVDIARLQSERNTAQALQDIAGEEADFRRREALVQRDVNLQLHQKLDDLSAQMRTLQDDLFGKNRSLDVLSDRYNVILEEFANAKKYIQLNDLELPKDFRYLDDVAAPPPRVEGVVRDTRKSKQRGVEFVEISLGSDDGLAEGHSLVVIRPAEPNGKAAQYLGTIQLVLLTPDRAVGTVVQKAKNGVIQAGDYVTTKL